MIKPILVVMAAGMGSRYGGPKQLTPVGENQQLLIDYSLYDAKRAGFDDVVFIINRRIAADFQETILNRISRHFRVQCVYQEVSGMLPAGIVPPAARTKPWGTGHAVFCCKDAVHAPFAVINADDYYGPHAFATLYEQLSACKDGDMQHWCMVGYMLQNTLTEHGRVARGVCEVNANDMLSDITERVQIEKHPEGPAYSEDGGQTFHPLAGEQIVSMNLWGFTSPGIFLELAQQWPAFLARALSENPTGAEYFLPSVVNAALQAGRADVRVLRSPDHWYGITYKADLNAVVSAIRHMTLSDMYPENLWE